jgi:PAS domain S-box-containing protein
MVHRDEILVDPAQSINVAVDLNSIGAAPLESIVCTEELLKRPSRPAHYELENSALTSLVSALADSPHTILQTLTDKVLEILQADSAGLSLLTKDEKRFYWAAISGKWRPHIGGGTPRDFGPCGDVLDRNVPMLFTHWERRYPYLSSATPLADEGLLVPFYVSGKAVGTIWVIAHSGRRKFDAEDLRLLESMGRFASAAYQTVESIEGLKLEVAAREKAEAAVREMASGMQTKIRCLVDSNIIGIFIWTSSGGIIDANDAFLRIVGYGREDLMAGHLSWVELTPPEWRDRTARAAEVARITGAVQPFEKEYFRKDGSRVPVLVGRAMFEGRPNEGVGFVVDLTERKRAEREARESEQRYREVQMELAHANRVATTGQLTASIAHEVKQPISAAVANAQAALRFLAHQPAELDKIRQTLEAIVQAGYRAGDVIDRIRALIKKAPPRKERLDINVAIREVTELTRAEAMKNGVSVQTNFANGLPLIEGDRVQLQQVILNLMMNAIEAMSGFSDGTRQLLIKTQEAERSGVLVAVRDSGPGLEAATLDRLFDAFYTTKPGGLGMGLSISRSIIEAHSGRLWASANLPRGAAFEFILPIHPEHYH